MRATRAALALACAGVLAIVPAGVALSQAEPEQPTLGPEEAQSVPTLSSAAVNGAANVMEGDSGLAEVLGDAQAATTASAGRRVSRAAIVRTVRRDRRAHRASSGYTLRDIGIWSDEDGRAFGVELTVGLPEPMTITADWPTLAEPDSGWTSPTVHYTARNVTALTIDVDLDQRRVVNVEPDPGADVEAPEGTELPAPEDGGE